MPDKIPHLNQSLKELERCLNLVPHSVCIADQFLNLKFMNAAMIEFVGVDKAAAKSFSEFIYTDDLEIVAAIMRGLSKSSEIRVQEKDGSYVFCSITAQRFSLGVKAQNLIILSLSNINQNKPGLTKIENNFEKLLVSEFKSRVLAEALPHFVWSCNKDGDCEFVNQRFCDYAGVSEAQCLGKGWLSLLHPDDKENAQALWIKAGFEPGIYSFEHRLRGADGNYCWFKSSANAICNGAGEVIKWFGTSSDITDQKLIREKLDSAEQLTLLQGLEVKRTETRLRAILSSMKEGLCQLDAEGRFVYLNGAAEELLEYEMGAVLGQRMHELVHDVASCSAGHAKSECPMLAAIDSGKPYNNEEELLRTKSGGAINVQYSSAPLKTAQAIAGTVVVFRDISELIKLRQQKESFFAILAHDLKTPLIAADRVLGPLIKGASGPLNEEQQSVLALLQRSNADLLTMVQDLLALYRYSEARFLSQASVDIMQPAAQIIERFTGIAAAKNVTITHTLDTSMPPVNVDKTAIEHLLNNLLDNAIKFTPPCGTINVSVKAVGENVELQVRNSGSGMSQSELQKLFSPFFQGETGKRQASGSGLGLYLCRQIIESYDGKISCISSTNDGTTFLVTMPAKLK